MALGRELPRDRSGTWAPMLEESSPAATAVSRTLSSPVSMPSCMNGVLTEWASALPRLIRPQSFFPSLCAATFLPLRSQ